MRSKILRHIIYRSVSKGNSVFSTDKLTMIYGDRVLFQDVTLHFHAHRRYGLVGANGAGKTAAGGKQPPTSGIVQIPRDAKVGILDQDYFHFGDKKVLDIFLMGDKELWEAVEKKEAL